MNAGREMDAIIAEKVMGWTDLDWSSGYYAVATSPTNPRLRIGVPHYSASIDAACEVLDQLGGIVTITRMAPDDWRVEIGSSVCWAETLPLAICRAALDAAGVGVPA